jgi:hypothetical protein
MAEDTNGAHLVPQAPDAPAPPSRVIEDAVQAAVADIANPAERERVRQSVTDALRASLLAIAGAPGEAAAQADPLTTGGAPADAAAQANLLTIAPPAAGAEVQMDTIGAAAQAGMNVLKDVKDLGFADFTRDLINHTFDAIVGAQIRQMEAYADLVAELAKTLAQFQASNVSDADVTLYLAQRFTDGQGGTSVRADYTYASAADMQAVDDALAAEIQGISAIVAPATAPKFLATQVKDIRTAVAAELARRMQTRLRDMARDGMARIDVTEGSITSRLTFTVRTSESASATQSTYHNATANAAVSSTFGFKRFGGSIAASGRILNVQTANQSTFSSVNTDATILGEVKIGFRTTSFASHPPV